MKKGIIEIRADIAVRTPNQNNLLDDITDSINNFQTLSGHCQTIIATYLNRRNNNNYVSFHVLTISFNSLDISVIY